MCGVTGIVGKEPCVRTIFANLKHLEYRGYDSSGISVIAGNQIATVKQKGRIEELAPLLAELPESATIGMGHTRWATHGRPSNINAHPHVTENIALIHNGIIENHQELRSFLQHQGFQFTSETDSEVVLHLLEYEVSRQPDFRTALLSTITKLHGAYGFGIISTYDPTAIYVVKKGSPLVVGLGKEQNYFASDLLPLAQYTNRFCILEDGEAARITADSVEFFKFNGDVIEKTPQTIDWNPGSFEKRGYRHYMLKEIYEQPLSLSNILDRALLEDQPGLNDQFLGTDLLSLDAIKRIHIVACGTAYFAGVVTQYVCEKTLRIPTTVELASEFRYRQPCIDQETLLIVFSQSGETIDTLTSVNYAREMGAQILAITNVQYSSTARAATSVLHMNAGPEVGVASTKAFTSMILSGYLFVVRFAMKRNLLSSSEFDTICEQLKKLPFMVEKTLEQSSAIKTIAHKYQNQKSCLFIGRNLSYPIALEGALKLKEISYIHAEGYAGGELKHGPLALVDQDMLVISILPKDSIYDKTLSNVEEILARDGQVVVISTEDADMHRGCHHHIACPKVDSEVLQTIISVIPLQLFAYHVATCRGTDVDQPRNLAKSVTVE